MQVPPRASIPPRWFAGSDALVLAVLVGCGPPPSPSASEPTPPPAPAPAFLKGQLHLHSSNSGDSQTPPEDVVRWYAEHGYDFIVFTDHNRITQTPAHESMQVFAGIELTGNLPRCDPPPEPGLSCLLHVNGLFVDPDRATDAAALERPDSLSRLAHYGHALQVAESLGGVAMLNHPNFHLAADAELLSRLVDRGLSLFEVANEAIDSNNEGDARHPSTERLWDQVLTSGRRLYGVATDDAHHYDDAAAVRARGEIAHVGDRGFVMVRAEPTAASIRNALLGGDFYASSGVLLGQLSVGDGRLLIDVERGCDPLDIRITGEDGRLLHRTADRRVEFDLGSMSSSYARATVTDCAGKKAWIQPVWPR